MTRNPKSVPRLTLIFIITLIISGSILTYFSINNISNFKELTIKRISEEQELIFEGISKTFDVPQQIIGPVNHHYISLRAFVCRRRRSTAGTRVTDFRRTEWTPLRIGETSKFSVDPMARYRRCIPRLPYPGGTVHQGEWQI